MKLFVTVLLAAFFAIPVYGQDCAEAYTTASNVGVTITNQGIVGNSFRGNFNLNNWPSCEYPVNSGIEHVFEGGFWIGAKINGVTEAVSTGAVDASSGYSPGRSGFELYAPQGQCIEERSSLFDNPNFSPFAISHQDFVTNFADTALLVPGTNIQIGNQSDPHEPLGVSVHMETYNWNFSFANFFVILNFHVENVGNDVLEELYLGYWMDAVIRNINITPPGGSAFFNKGGNGYIDSLYMAYEFDATGDPGFTDTYFGLKFLGSEDKMGFHHPKLDSNFKDNFNTWQFRNTADPLYFFPELDNQRFGKMSLGINQNPILDWNGSIKANLKTASNRSLLISSGPFPTLNPGESVDIAYALVLAKKKRDGGPNTDDSDEQKANLIQNAFWAQTAYNGEDINFNGVLDPGEDRNGNNAIDRYILPAPPDIPHTKVVADNHKIEIFWTKNAENSIDPISKQKDFEGYRLYKTKLGFDVVDQQDIFESLKLVSQFDQPNNALFFDTGFDGILLPEVKRFEGDTNSYWYHYTFENVQNGWQHAVAITAFDQGDPENNLQSLESSSLANLKRVFAGQKANSGFENGDPYVYPNPYYGGASWEGASTFEEDRKLIFANLPQRCKIRIYTVAGDFVDEIEHSEAYRGDDIKWFETYSDTKETSFSGGEHAWDLLSKDNQIIARGIYLYSVRDEDSGENFEGKFVIIK